MHLDFLHKDGFFLFLFFNYLTGWSFLTSVWFLLFSAMEALSILELHKKMEIKRLEAELRHHLPVAAAHCWFIQGKKLNRQILQSSMPASYSQKLELDRLQILLQTLNWLNYPLQSRWRHKYRGFSSFFVRQSLKQLMSFLMDKNTMLSIRKAFYVL